jgi:dihydrodipicolinate synthase/N-acetylneuraminate lyase
MPLNSPPRRWTGIFPPLVTPLSGPDDLDVPGLERLIEHVLEGGVHGLFILGTTGEGPSLSYRLRRELIERTLRQVGERVPVLVGITDTAAREMVSLGTFAAERGAEALVLAPPCYFPNSQPELLEYIRRAARILPAPVFLYNMPTHTKTHLEIETVRRAFDEPNIAGIKDSSGNMVYFHHLIALAAQHGSRPVLMGPEELLGDAILFGGSGGVSGGANLFPRLYVSIFEAARDGRLARVRELHDLVLKISGSLYQVGSYGSGFLKGLKCALSLRGICSGGMADPFQGFAGVEVERVRDLLDPLAGEVARLLDESRGAATSRPAEFVSTIA